MAALLSIAAALPGDLPAALLIVMHVGAQRSVVPQLMGQRCALPVAQVRHDEALHAGLVRVAPADHHLLVADGLLELSRGPKENFARPAIDPLFRSAASACGPARVGVVLTGGLDDGTAGLQAIKQCGGVAVVQDPDDAFDPSMPASALQHVQVDHCLPRASIAPLLVSLAAQPVAPQRAVPIEQLQHEHALMLAQGEPMEHLSLPHRPRVHRTEPRACVRGGRRRSPAGTRCARCRSGRCSSSSWHSAGAAKAGPTRRRAWKPQHGNFASKPMCCGRPSRCCPAETARRHSAARDVT